MTVTLIKGVEIGQIPPTPINLTVALDEAYRALRKIAYKYGIPAAYKQEQNGRLIQHIFPRQIVEDIQISSSSKVELQLHTETAFHIYPPSYVILMCLRGDPEAFTTYATLDDIIPCLDDETLFYLKEPLFVTEIDESFRTNGQENKTIVLPVLVETKDGLSIFFDDFFMKGQTIEAEEALVKLRLAISQNTKEIALEAGDVLVLDNRKVVHGRKSFTARYDGTDRWLLRVLTLGSTPPETQYTYDDHMTITTEL